MLCLEVGSGLFYATRQRRDTPAGAADPGPRRSQDDGGLVEPPRKPGIQPTEHKAEPPTQRFQGISKRLGRLFGTLAVIGGLVFVLLLPLGILIDADILGYLAIAGFYAALFLGVLWFACWALGKLWK